MEFPGVTAIKNLPANAGDTRDTGPIPGLGRSPGGGNGNLFHDSCWGRSCGQRSLEGCSPWGPRESDTSKALSKHALGVSAWAEEEALSWDAGRRQPGPPLRALVPQSCFLAPTPRHQALAPLQLGTTLGKWVWEAAGVPREREASAGQHSSIWGSEGRRASQSPSQAGSGPEVIRSESPSSCKALRLHKAAGRQGRAQAVVIINNTVIIVNEVG